MKVLIVVLTLVCNLLAFTINNKEFFIGMNIDSIDINVFNVKLDSIEKGSVINYKYVAESKNLLDVEGFSKVIIEATLSKTIYNITLINKKTYISKDSPNIGFAKKFFNDNVVTFEG
jgi:hypothetical protein